MLDISKSGKFNVCPHVCTTGRQLTSPLDFFLLPSRSEGSVFSRRQGLGSSLRRLQAFTKTESDSNRRCLMNRIMYYLQCYLRSLPLRPGAYCRAGLACLAALLSGCANLVDHHYSAATLRMEKGLQLEVDTYPADYGHDGFHIPFLYLRMHTADQVLFQVYLRNAQRAIRNSSKGIESMQIRGFSYQFPDEERVDLITAKNPVSNNFWQQREGPLPFREGVSVRVWMTFALNGELHSVQREMIGRSKTGACYPLILQLWAT